MHAARSLQTCVHIRIQLSSKAASRHAKHAHVGLQISQARMHTSMQACCPVGKREHARAAHARMHVYMLKGVWSGRQPCIVAARMPHMPTSAHKVQASKHSNRHAVSDACRQGACKLLLENASKTKHATMQAGRRAEFATPSMQAFTMQSGKRMQAGKLESPQICRHAGMHACRLACMHACSRAQRKARSYYRG